MRLAIAAAMLAVAASSTAAPTSTTQPTPPMFKALTDCRAISDPQSRLRCFDAAVAALDNAAATGDIVVADKTQIQESKKALFGFGGIRLPIFGGRDQDEAPTEIEATITGLRDLGYGKYEFVLDNGSHWRQTEGDIFPRVGQKVQIKLAALGSYRLRAGQQRWVRVMRIQ